MLKHRLISAAIIISTSLVCVALDANYQPWGVTGFWMLPLGLFLFFGSAIECVSMVKPEAWGSITWPALIGCGGVMAGAIVPMLWPISGEAYPADCMLGALGWPLAAGLISVVACFGWYIPSYRPDSNFFGRAILAGWVSIYFGCCFAFAINLRLVGDGAWGLFLLVGVILVTKFADSGAYFCGRALGRTKLCPTVSPGKTIEGLIGGMVVAVLAGWIYFSVCGPLAFDSEELDVHPLGVIVLGVALTLAGVLGDLLESIFKREMGCKDSGSLLPGLGGLWDVTDSLLPGSVVGYLVVTAELIRGPGQ